MAKQIFALEPEALEEEEITLNIQQFTCQKVSVSTESLIVHHRLLEA